MSTHARTIMTPHVTSVGTDTTLREVAGLLMKAWFDGVPVVDGDQRLCGFLTGTDVAQAALHGRLDERAKDAMANDVPFVDEFATAEEVMRLFRERHVHHLPVVRQGVVVGIITPADVIRHLVSAGDDVA